MPFTGTWHQAPLGAEQAVPVGFLGIDADHVLFNLDGLPRGSVAIAQNDTDAGLRSGRLVCADGRVLYVAVGDSLTTRESDEGQLLTPTVHLDVHVFAPGAGPGDAPQRVLRLWPSAALAVATLPTRPRTMAATTPAVAPAPVVAAAPAVAPTTAMVAPVAPVDQRFVSELSAVNDPLLRTLSATMVGARQDGMTATDLDALFRRCTLLVRSDLVRDLDAARRGERAALSRADQRIQDLTRADHAYQDWRGGH
jgi:hypothetical protein